MATLSRRGFLRVGAGAAALATWTPPHAAATPVPTMVTGSFVSAARGGVPTNWAIARPPNQAGPLRPLIALHGKGSNAAAVMAGGVEQALAGAVAADYLTRGMAIPLGYLLERTLMVSFLGMLASSIMLLLLFPRSRTD